MVILLVSISTAVFAQKGGPRSGYNFTTVVDLKTTPVKNQQSVGTCWGLRNSLILRIRIAAQRQTCL